MSVKVLLPQPILPEGYAYLKDHGFEVVDGRGFTEDDIIADIADCDAMIVRTAKITRKIIEAAPKLKIMSRHGAGYDMVDIEACKEKGIRHQEGRAGRQDPGPHRHRQHRRPGSPEGTLRLQHGSHRL